MKESTFFIKLDWENIFTMCQKNPEQYGEPNEKDFAEWVFTLCRETSGDNIFLTKLFNEFYVIQTTDEATAQSYREVSWCDWDGNTIAEFVEVQLLPKDFSRESVLDWIGENSTMNPYGRIDDLIGKDGNDDVYFGALSPCSNFNLYRQTETGRFISSDLQDKRVKIGEVFWILDDIHLFNRYNYRTNPTSLRPISEQNLHYIRIDFTCALSEYVVKQWFADWSFDGRLKCIDTRGSCMDFTKVIDIRTNKVIATH
jgi:hypothetical protein|tara:strand:+ start:1085 stop:1852 length:768 start_codon:yes stop_codon:yes gene_type:complete